LEAANATSKRRNAAEDAQVQAAGPAEAQKDNFKG